MAIVGGIIVDTVGKFFFEHKRKEQDQQHPKADDLRWSYLLLLC